MAIVRMATLLRTNLGRAFATSTLAAVAGCSSASTCNRINSTFIIDNWRGGLPQTVVVQVMKEAASGNKTIAATIDYKPAISPHAEGPSLILAPDLAKHPFLLATDDYRIVVDERLEYLVHGIAMTDRGNLDCPMKAAEVNACKLGRSNFLEFDATCGRPLPSESAK